MSANIKNENIDLTSILKDVENCIRSGLSNKLDTFFYEYDKYKKTHEEVLNLSIVKELLKNSSSTLSRSSEDTKPKLDPELEMIVLRNQVMYLRGEVNKYKSQVEEHSQRQTKIVTIKPEYSHINLEVKEEEREPLDIKSENEDEYGDGDVSITSDSGDTSDSSNSSDSDIIEDNIQNIVLNVTEKDERNVEEDDHHEEEVEVKEIEVDSEEEAEAEEEAAEENDEEEEDADEDEDEEEDIVVKMPTFPTKKVDEVKSVIEETKTEEHTEEEDEEQEQEQEQEQEEEEVETETEEDSDEEQATETILDTKTLEVKVETETKTETEVAQDEEEEEEEEEEELYEVEINGVMYVTNDDEDGTIYSYIDEEVGDKVGEFKGLVAHIYNGKNKGIYDRTKCKLNF